MLQFLKFDTKITNFLFRLFSTNMITITPNAKFSYNLVKGANQARNQFVSNLNEKFFDAFCSQINNKNLRLKDIKKIYEELLPEPKKIEVKRYKGDKKGNTGLLDLRRCIRFNKIHFLQRILHRK